MKPALKAWITGGLIGLTIGIGSVVWLSPVRTTLLPPENDPHDLYRVASGQIAAFQHRNYSAAYAFAASGIREKFPLEQFSQMIRETYPQLLRAGCLNFGATHFVPGDRASLLIYVTSSSGAVPAIYTFVKEDGIWKIEGVELIRSAAPDAVATDLQT